MSLGASAESAALPVPVAMLVCLLLAFVLIASAAQAESLTGYVVAIDDGDSLTVLDSAKTLHRIRLAGIDAPERGQPGSQRSKDSLARFVADREVRVEWSKRDDCGRLVGKVWVVSPDMPCRDQPDCPKTLDAGLAQLTIGRAWWFRRFAAEQSPEDRSRYEFAETEARARRAGLWRDANPVPPWEWRNSRPGTKRN